MSFQVGDKVKVLDDSLEGTIVSIKNKIAVEIDGLIFEFKNNQLLKIDKDVLELDDLYRTHPPSSNTIKQGNKSKPNLAGFDQKSMELGKVRGKRNKKNILEFDLHIHDLLASSHSMTNGEMLNYQLDYAVNCLEASIKKNERAIIFIHGIGKGVLKNELLAIINAYKLEYQDGFMNEYGFGATKVQLR